MPTPDPKPKKRRSGQAHMFVSKAHSKKAGKRQGYRERIVDCRRIAWRCRIEGQSVRETCKIVQAEMNLPDPPDYTTVCRWLSDAFDEKIQETAKHKEQFIAVAMPRLEMLIRKWMPIATADKFFVERFEKQDGESIAVMDENAFQEQAKAADVVLKTIESARRILGVGLAAPDIAAGPQATITQINAIILQTINGAAPKAGDRMGSTPLLLGTGEAE